MGNKSFYLVCGKCEEKSTKVPAKNIPFLSKHLDKNCPTEGIWMVFFDYGQREAYDTEDSEVQRALELKNCLSRARKLLKDFINLPDWKYANDVSSIIDETVTLRRKIVEDLNSEDT